jgi:hypothetical protein
MNSIKVELAGLIKRIDNFLAKWLLKYILKHFILDFIIFFY